MNFITTHPRNTRIGYSGTAAFVLEEFEFPLTIDRGSLQPGTLLELGEASVKVAHIWRPEECPVAAAIASGLLKFPDITGAAVLAEGETLRMLGKLAGPKRRETSDAEARAYDCIVVSAGDCATLAAVRAKMDEILWRFGDLKSGWLLLEVRRDLDYEELVKRCAGENLKVREQTDLSKFRDNRRLMLFRFRRPTQEQPQEQQQLLLPLTEALIREAAVNVLAAYHAGALAGMRAREIARLAEFISVSGLPPTPGAAPPGFEDIH